MRPLNLKLADVGQTASPRVPSVAVSQPLEFVGYLARKHAIAGNLLSNLTAPDRPGREKRLRDLWEVTDLSAEDFANEVAHFYKLPRIDLPQLIAATSLANRFSHRFLREVTVFPCQLEEGGPNILVMADPTDAATVRAAELCLGGPVNLAIASFDDIATVLAEQLGNETLPIPEQDEWKCNPSEHRYR